jgi:hypothetical protein
MASVSRAATSLLAPLLVVAVLCLNGSAPLFAQDSDEANMDKLMAPIALYPDALLAQLLTAATSPDQVTAFHDWLGKQTATGSDLQQAAMDADFDAAFASLALFPEVVATLAENMDWTKEIGTAYLSDQDAVSASIQRLRAQAKEQGNLESGEEQTVTVNNEGGNQTIIIEPTNPQVVYVPQYPTTVYTEPAPAGGALFGFALGIAIGAAMHNEYYGYGAWGYGWHGGGVHYHHAVWHAPPHGHYGYSHSVHGYHASANVVAPRRTNVNINVDNSRTNIGNKVGNDGNRGDGGRGDGGRGDDGRGDGGRGDAGRGDAGRGDGNRGDAGRGSASDRPSAGTMDKPGDRGGSDRAKPATSDRGRGDGGSSPAASSRDRTSSGGSSKVGGESRRSGGSQSALGGYSSGSSTRAASSRGRASTGGGRSSGGGGGRRR